MNIKNEVSEEEARDRSEELQEALEKSIAETVAYICRSKKMSFEEGHHLLKLTELTVAGVMASAALTAEANGVAKEVLTIAVVGSLAVWDRKVNALVAAAKK